MSTPDENMYRDLLKDYAAPTPDNAFSDNLMQKLTEQTNATHTRANLKPHILASASLAGGAIAALQIPNLIRLLDRIPAPALPAIEPPISLPLPETTQLTAQLSHLPSWSIAGLAIFALIIATTLMDQISS